MAKLYDVAVVGGGLAGACAALAAAHAGYRTAIVAPKTGKADGRTTALMGPSVALLEKLKIWQSVSDVAAPLRTMRIIDGTSRLLRAPTVTFHSSELDLDAFGYNIPNAPLLDVLHDALDRTDNIDRYGHPVKTVVDQSTQVDLGLADGEHITALLVAGADGRNSLVRQAIGIGVRDWRYPQTALVLNFFHEFSHVDTSNEFHTEDGPFTQVPLPGKKSSLVWAMKPADADARAALPAGELALEIEERMQSMLGKVRIEGTVQRFPFSGMIAQSFARARIMLIGEAGHVFPPIGAQGLNLGLRDVVDFVEAINSAGGVTEAHEVAGHYNRLRRSDVASRTFGVDMLNRSLLSGLLPIQLMRSAGLSALLHVGPLRQFAMREGVSPGTGLRGFAGRHRPG
jgi:2-octaprenyl-6-methoxyphenol hydroxylase